ncbi:MAG: TIGR04076 family protein [Deltaproteobacteria bacterium]|nr:TIGR04076 family protein [Deltaproteobacteria bacterium]MBW2137469.1 TIGR04076 family protein [Deltaproteobacteria bacterium]
MNILKVTVERIDGYCSQSLLVGDCFYIEREGMQLTVPEGKHICLWALQSMMPIFPLLQRSEPKKGDWASKEGQVFVCPDPKGLVHYRIERIRESC